MDPEKRWGVGRGLFLLGRRLGKKRDCLEGTGKARSEDGRPRGGVRLPSSLNGGAAGSVELNLRSRVRATYRSRQ